MYSVRQNYERVSQKLIEAFSSQAVASVYEASGKKGMVDPQIVARTRPRRVCGAALTVSCRTGDNLMIHKAVSIARPGDVLVVEASGYANAGAWGEILTVAAQARGVVGLVIDGSVRDTEPTSKRGFPVFSRGVCVGATTKSMPGLINHAITCGGIRVEAGDLVLGDADGVVVVARAEAEKVLEETIAREEKEQTIMRRLEAGETTLDVLGFGDAVAALDLDDEPVR